MGTHIKSIEETRAIMDLIRMIVRSLRISTRRFEKTCGLSGAQIFLLQQINANRRICVNALAQRTFTHQSTVSEGLVQLVRRGLVKKEASREDRRKWELYLTLRGQRALRGIPRTAQETLTIAIRKLTPRKRQKVAALLREIVLNAHWLKKSPPLFFTNEKDQHDDDQG